MSKHVFVSCDFEDRNLAHAVETFFESKVGNAKGRPAFVSDVLRDGYEAVDQEIHRTMNGCTAAMFVIGDNGRTSPWIDREVTLAITKGLPMITVRLPGTTGHLPARLSGVDVVNWDHDSMRSALNKILRFN